MIYYLKYWLVGFQHRYMRFESKNGWFLDVDSFDLQDVDLVKDKFTYPLSANITLSADFNQPIQDLHFLEKRDSLWYTQPEIEALDRGTYKVKEVDDLSLFHLGGSSV